MAPQTLQWILRNGKLRLTAPPTLYRCEPIWSWRVPSMQEYGLLLTLDGRGQISINGERHPLRQGVCLFIRPGSKIEAEQNPAYPLFLFIARFDILDEKGFNLAPSSLVEPPSCIFIINTRGLETLAELIASRSNSNSEADSLTHDALNMLIRMLVEEATRHSGSFHAQAYEALRAIENDLARKWTVAELALEAGLSRRVFARAFKLMMSEPPIQYVIRRRMEEAKRQIQQSSLPIEEIAINLGYPDLGLFGELFRKRIGHSPEELRVNRPF